MGPATPDKTEPVAGRARAETYDSHMADHSPITWFLSDDREPGALDAFENVTGTRLHPIAREHLLDSAHHRTTPFPRLENHGKYLFGMVFVPSSTSNTSADFDRVVFAIAHDAAIASVATHPTSTQDWASIAGAIGKTDRYAGDSCTGGRFLLELLGVTVTQLLLDATNLQETINVKTSQLGVGVDLTKDIDDLPLAAMSSRQRRTMLQRFRELGPTLSAIKHEMPSMLAVVTESSDVLARLVNDDDTIDIKTDNSGDSRELFSKELEIFLSDIWIDCRNLTAVLTGIDSSIITTKEFMKQLNDEENVASNRFTGAIASIMLLPTFIVGLYGQNFDDMPETHWHYGYGFSWGAIIVLTVAQVWFFRRRKWL
ncbi:MAG: hypothetical protein RL430_143 [Actinomycetota bacterium]|jgi:magnesium transporter